MKIRHDPSGIDKCEGIIELKPVGRGGNLRVRDWEVHEIFRHVLGLFGGARDRAYEMGLGVPDLCQPRPSKFNHFVEVTVK